MEFRLRDRPTAGPKGGEQEVDDTTKNAALDAAASARRALEAVNKADEKRAEAARLRRRQQRQETQKRGNFGGCVC